MENAKALSLVNPPLSDTLVVASGVRLGRRRAGRNQPGCQGDEENK
jgi:hypothetical protein